jgi:hypothetical protein
MLADTKSTPIAVATISTGLSDGFELHGDHRRSEVEPEAAARRHLAEEMHKGVALTAAEFGDDATATDCGVRCSGSVATEKLPTTQWPRRSLSCWGVQNAGTFQRNSFLATDAT